MTNVHASARQVLRRAAHVGRALRDDARATAAVEAALILPVALTMFALLLYGAEAFAIQRKVTLTARTITDLITQTTPTMVNNQPSVPQ
jgi:Flp pilus assembly protein TadG